MATDKFNWKGLFVNDVEIENTSSPSKQSGQVETHTFPDSTKATSQFPDSNPSQKLKVSQSILDSILAMYQSGFESLNNPGYDFFEFFKAIESVGNHDPQVYKMAMAMAQTVDKNVNKELLLSKSEYYIAEINKVHNQYLTQGNAKKNQIQDEQKSNKALLNSEISDLEENLIHIKAQIDRKKVELQSLDANMITEVSEIEQKISCNDIAKAKILEEILKVVNGIKNNI